VSVGGMESAMWPTWIRVSATRIASKPAI
jgi:hypothetical protein